MKRMLFNATHPEELRVAIVDGQTLVDLDIEFLTSENKRGNIYKGTVTKVEPSLEAVFVDYGTPRQGFLSLKDISRTYFSENYSASTPMAQVKIQDVIDVGDELIVQIEKNERGTKGAALTTFISLAGRSLVLLPNNPRSGGISRQVEGSSRHELKEILSSLELPTEHSVIVRTAGIGQSADNFHADLNYLVNLWRVIEKTAKESDPRTLIYQESSLIVRTLRDYLKNDVSQILIDDHDLFVKTEAFVRDLMPESEVQVKHYQDAVPLFSKFQIEHQIKNAFEPKVTLPNGGEIVIEQTEAMVTIDVNSARSTKGSDIEETALETNLEAVEQIAKQLRVRDIGGLIVIDLIDMNASRNRKKVEKHFIEAIESDRARARVGRISQFGLLEMSRQRLRSSIEESSHDKCPRCKGHGYIRSVTSTALSILRLIDDDSRKESSELIHAHLPIEVATFLINEKRHEINAIESRTGTRVVIVPTKSMLTPDYEIKRFTADELEGVENNLSYVIRSTHSASETYNFVSSVNTLKQAAISQEDLMRPASASERKPLITRVVSSLFSKSSETEKKKKPAPSSKKTERKNVRKSTSSKSASSKQRREDRPAKRGGQTRGKQSDQSKASANTRKPNDSKRRPRQPSGNSIYYSDPNAPQQSQTKVGPNGSNATQKSGNRVRRNTRGRPRSSGGDRSAGNS